MNMSRIGTYCEKSYRLHYEIPSDFFKFNTELVQSNCSSHRIVAADCSYIPKSGKKTARLGKFRNGCASGPGKGLEISSLAVTDVDNNTAMHLGCKQTPGTLKDDGSRTDFYLAQIVEKKNELRQIATDIVTDGAYPKTGYVNGIANRTELHPVSELRKDANLRYLCTGPAYKIKHAHILLNADSEGTNKSDNEIADIFHYHINISANVRQRFVEQGLESALEAKSVKHRRL